MVTFLSGHLDTSAMCEKIDRDGRLQIEPAEWWHDQHPDALRLFMHKHGVYVIPTTELLGYLRKVIRGRTALEIGAGHGSLSRALGIRITDAKIQNLPEVRAIYDRMKQPVIKYPPDVEEIHANDAVSKYEPQVVFGTYITSYSPTPPGNPYGVLEEPIINTTEMYIHVGNDRTHNFKPAMLLPHAEVTAPWVITRGEADSNRIWVWGS